MRTKKITSVIVYLLATVFFMMGILLVFLNLWIYGTFGQPTIEQIFFHLFTVRNADSGVVSSFASNVLLPASFYVILFIGFIFLTILIGRKQQFRRFAKILRWAIVPLSLCFFILEVYQFILPFDIKSWIKSRGNPTETTIYESEYKAFKGIEFKEKRNLIVLLLESLEATYTNTEAFNENLLPRLGKNIQKWHHPQLNGTECTITGTVAYLCGLPLKFYYNVENGASSVIPGAPALTDILAENGYTIYTLQGSPLNFAGMNFFWSSHSVLQENSLGKRELQNAGLNKTDRYAVMDKDLYEIAQGIISDCWEKQKQPFALFISTYDTHLSGILDPSCKRKYDDYRDIVLCADTLAGNFIDWIEKQPCSKNTVIVALSDHLAMRNDIFDRFPEKNKRSNLTLFINPVKPLPDVFRTISHFDILPTIVESIGGVIPDGRLALGVSLYNNQPTLIERYGEKLNEQINKPSLLYNSFFEMKKSNEQRK